MNSVSARSSVLPSDMLNYYKHDCRLESLKFRYRNSLYDVSKLTSILNNTKSSLNLIYDAYLAERNHFVNLKKKSANSDERQLVDEFESDK